MHPSLSKNKVSRHTRSQESFAHVVIEWKLNIHRWSFWSMRRVMTDACQKWETRNLIRSTVKWDDHTIGQDGLGTYDAFWAHANRPTVVGIGAQRKGSTHSPKWQAWETAQLAINSGSNREMSVVRLSTTPKWQCAEVCNASNKMMATDTLENCAMTAAARETCTCYKYNVGHNDLALSVCKRPFADRPLNISQGSMVTTDVYRQQVWHEQDTSNDANSKIRDSLWWICGTIHFRYNELSEHFTKTDWSPLGQLSSYLALRS